MSVAQLNIASDELQNAAEALKAEHATEANAAGVGESADKEGEVTAQATGEDKGDALTLEHEGGASLPQTPVDDAAQTAIFLLENSQG